MQDKKENHSELMGRLFREGKIKTTKGKKKETKECEVCSRHISLCNYDKHILAHKNKKYKTEHKLLECPHCNRKIRNKDLHFNNCIDNPNREGRSNIWTEERRLNHSKIMKQVVRENPDSYSKNNVCGRVKITKYKDSINLKGSWEVKVAEWLDAQGIRWENEANPKPYYWNNDWKLYFPDFYLIDYECYIEVKGYRTDRDIAKWDYFDCDILIFEKESIDKIDQFSIQYALEWLNWKNEDIV